MIETPVITGENYHAAVKELNDLMADDPSPETENGQRIAVLGYAIEKYEKAVEFPPLTLDELRKMWRANIEEDDYEDGYTIATQLIGALEKRIVQLERPQVHVLVNPGRDGTVHGSEVREVLAEAMENARKLD